MTEGILKLVVPPLLSYLLKRREGPHDPIPSKSDLEKGITRHLKELNSWANDIQFFGMSSPMHTSDDSIPLSFHTSPRKFKNKTTRDITQDEGYLLKSNKNVLLLGDPGAGKTTTLKRIALRLLTNEPEENDTYMFAILIQVKEIGKEKTLLEHLLAKLSLSHLIEKPPTGIHLRDRSDYLIVSGTPLIDFVSELVEELNCVILVDGIDEAEAEKASIIFNDLSCLSARIDKSKIIASCRSGDYTRTISYFELLEIQPLDTTQIREIGKIWLKEDFKKFEIAVNKGPYRDLVDRPLVLTQLLFLYSKQGDLPEQPFAIYQQITRLLLRDWDFDRNIKRKSMYANFNPDRKLQFLSTLSYHLTYKKKRKSFTRVDFLTIYKDIHKEFNLPENESLSVATEIESHTGLIINSGFDHFEFSHLSLQEYLCADYIVRAPFTDVVKNYFLEYPAPIAVAVAMSSDAGEWLGNLILKIKVRDFEYDSQSPELLVSSFLSRLVLEKPIFKVADHVGLSFLIIFDYLSGKHDSLILRTLEITNVPESICLVLRLYAINRQESTGSTSFLLQMQCSQFKDNQFPGAKEVQISKKILFKLLKDTNGIIDWIDDNELIHRATLGSRSVILRKRQGFK